MIDEIPVFNLEEAKEPKVYLKDAERFAKQLYDATGICLGDVYIQRASQSQGTDQIRELTLVCAVWGEND